VRRRIQAGWRRREVSVVTDGKMGSLTGFQLQVMEQVWAAGKAGKSVAEIWQGLREERDLARTTVLTMVRRLEKRGWLRRRGRPPKTRYVAARSREETVGRVASGFVDEFFGGSASKLVMSLLGSGRLDARQVERLKSALDQYEQEERGR